MSHIAAIPVWAVPSATCIPAAPAHAPARAPIAVPAGIPAAIPPWVIPRPVPRVIVIPRIPGVIIPRTIIPRILHHDYRIVPITVILAQAVIAIIVLHLVITVGALQRVTVHRRATLHRVKHHNVRTRAGLCAVRWAVGPAVCSPTVILVHTPG